MIQGALQIDEDMSESVDVDDPEMISLSNISIFNYPEQIVNPLLEGEPKTYAHRKSSIPIIAVINCLQEQN